MECRGKRYCEIVEELGLGRKKSGVQQSGRRSMKVAECEGERWGKGGERRRTGEGGKGGERGWSKRRGRKWGEGERRRRMGEKVGLRRRRRGR